MNDEVGFRALIQSWQLFKKQSLDGVQAQTINERLYSFGLFEAWDAGGSEEHRKLMAKVLANA